MWPNHSVQQISQRSRQGAHWRALYLFDEADETPPEAPRLVAVALQRADGDLLRLLHCHGHHVHGVVHQRRVRLQTEGVISLGIFITPANTSVHMTF